MNSPRIPQSPTDPTMTDTRELIESASLDALGLLDHDERRAFEDAFRAAPPHIQAEVRREQARFAESELSNLPPIDPPAGLRFKVLAAVRGAIGRATPAHPELRRGSASTLGFVGLWSSAAAWRVASLALASAVVTLGVFGYSFMSKNVELQANVDTLRGQAQTGQLNGSFPAIAFADDRTSIDLAVNPAFADALVLPDEASNAPARIDYSAALRKGTLFLHRLPVAQRNYRVVILDENGRVQRELERFNATGSFQVVSFACEPNEFVRVALVGPTEANGPEQVIFAASFA